MINHILVVDNDPLQLRTAELAIQKLFQCEVTTCADGLSAIDLLSSEKGQSIEVVLLDLMMPEIDGMEVLRRIKPVRPDLPVIIYTAHGEIKSAVEAMAEGAVDFVEKQDGEERLKVSLQNAARLLHLQHEISRLQRSAGGQTMFADIIGNSMPMLETKQLASQAADSSIPVLIKGESGVGKELFARAIHGTSDRQSHAFVPVNCGAIPENLVESVLFGHEKGAFTGAVEKAMGKFREADGGTLFLDEIGELKPELQVKLLRALQEGEVEPVGAAKPVNVNVRIISATNRPLKQDVENGNFREDLYYRLNVFPFTIPPLRDRRDDIPALVDHFIQTISSRESKPILGIKKSAKTALKEYRWPGNIRQLENAIYRAVVLSQSEWLDEEGFTHVLDAETTPSTANGGTRESLGQTGMAEQGLTDQVLSLLEENDHFKEYAELESEILENALNYYHWKISEVARRLKIGRSTLYRKMSEYDLQEPGFGSSANNADSA